MDKQKEILGSDILSLLKNFVETRIKEDTFRFYSGKVVSNNDPEKLGRIKIRVYGIFGNEIPDNDLPWAYPEPKLEGQFIVPENDTMVRVYFDDNDINVPIYTNKAYDKNSFNNSIAGKDDNYPETIVFFETRNGDYFKVNKETEEMEIRHSSGSLIIIDSDGNIDINNEGTTGNIKIVSQKSIEIEAVSQDINITSKGIPGNVNIKPNLIGKVQLGEGATQGVNNLPSCLFTGAPHGLSTGLPGGCTVKP